MKKLLALLLIPAFVLSLAMPASVSAQTKKAKGPSYAANVAKNKRSVAVSFSNLTNVKSISYRLTYDSASGPQGAQGSIKVTSKNKSLSRSLLLGTCSHKVCTYHKSVKNAKISVDFTLKSGGIVSYEKNLKI